MTALAQGRKTDPLGSLDTVLPVLLSFPVEANTSIFAGGIVAINAAGNAVPASASSALKVVGRCERDALNTSAAGFGSAGAIQVSVRQGAFFYNVNADSTISAASFGANLYASDDNTLSLSDAGGSRPYAGYVISSGVGEPGINTVGVGQVACLLGQPNPYQANPYLGLATQYKVRNVVTSLQAYGGSGTGVLTETANGAWQAQDGVTNVVGDVVFIFATTTNLTGAVDSGPWVITSLGSAGSKWVLTRPDWFAHGTAIIQGVEIDVGGEGTVWGGNTWRAMCGASQVVDTNDPTLYPRMQQVTTAAMTAGVSAANSTLFVWKNAQVAPLPKTPGGTQGTLRMSTQTSGYPGTSSLVVTSSSNTDTSTVTIQVDNF